MPWPACKAQDLRPCGATIGNGLRAPSSVLNRERLLGFRNPEISDLSIVEPLLLHRDYETRYTVDLGKVGAQKYAVAATTEVLCLALALDLLTAGEGWRRG